ncbi:hypothetical protein Tco_0651761 [Tanacetum coccineum]|uniref:Uncharacterized protein n=1 Tax=Tanacetum coccineum TaxID=301880 RepID=A0ABQ4WVT9_9ASTR
MEDDETLPTQTAPAPPTISAPIMVRATFTLPLAIKVAIPEDIATPPRKRCRSPSPPSPSSSSPPSSSPPSSVSPSPHLLCYHLKSAARRWMWVQPTIRTWRDEEGSPSTFEIRESSTAAHILLVTSEPIHRTIPLLVARIVCHEDQIHEMQDHLEELPVERFEAMEQDIEGLHGRIKATQHDVETL